MGQKMDQQNLFDYTISLLNKLHVSSHILEKLEKENVSDEYKKYLISGYIITLDSILEIGISDLHSSDLDELTSLIYYTRQKAVHYGYFNGIHNIEDIADRIITLTDTSYEKEKEFYSSLFNSSNFDLNATIYTSKATQTFFQVLPFLSLKARTNLKNFGFLLKMFSH